MTDLLAHLSPLLISTPPLTEADGHRDAAVLIALRNATTIPDMPLIVRAAGLRHHRGQIAFPGGQIEKTDIDPIAAALRESEEEINLDRNAVTVLGLLPVFTTRSGYRIFPVVGAVNVDLVLTPDPREVAAIFTMTLAALTAAPTPQLAWVNHDGQWLKAPVWDYRGQKIWGATLQILWSLRAHLQGWP